MAPFSWQESSALAFLAVLVVTDLPYFFYQRSGGKRFRRSVVLMNIVVVIFALVIVTGLSV
jgi:hypothetical protein